MPVEPNIHLNPLAIITAIIVSMVIDFLWYGPIFGKIWAKEMKMPADFKPTSGTMIKATILQLVGTFLTVFVLAHSQEIWRPSTWNLGNDGGNLMYGVMAAFFTWLGFYLPAVLSGMAWESKSLKLSFINGSNYLVTLMSQAIILATWR
jgi:Protein of unknown function (DUF1761)